MLPPKETKLDLRQLKDSIGHVGNLYMERRQFFAIRIGRYIFQLRKHIIHREDDDMNCHTHPFPFWSFRWKGGYAERELFMKMLDGRDVFRCKDRNRFSLSYQPKKAIHSIVYLYGDKPCTTIVLAILDTRDEKYGEWGFYENGKVVESSEYLNRPGKAGRTKTKVQA